MGKPFSSHQSTPDPEGCAQIDVIARHLDTQDAETVLCKGTRDEYVSAELGFDPKLQEQAFRFVKSDHRIEQSLRRTHAWIRIAGVGLSFFPHQLYGAFWLLVYERGPRRGAMLADSMGLGKTTTAYLYILLNHLLADNLNHIRRHPLMHCQPSTVDRPQAHDARCPISHFFGIECACQESSVAFQLGLTARNGASLIFVPAGLVGLWESEFGKLGLARHLGLRLYIQHRNFTSRRIPHSPTTSGCVSTAATADEGVVAGSLAPQDTAVSLYRILEALVHDVKEPPNFVALTGTPMLRNGVRDMVALVHVINQVSPALRGHPDFTDFSQLSQLQRIADDFLHSQTGPRGGSDLVVATVHRLLGAYCIRRHAQSFQNGKTLAHIPPLVCYEVSCPLPAGDGAQYVRDAESMLKKRLSKTLRSQLDRWQTEGGSTADFRVDLGLLLENVRIARLLASFPALARYGPRCNLTWNGIKSNEASSGKLQALRRFIDLWRPTRSYDGLAEGLVVISEFTMVCHVVDCFLTAMGVPCVWLHVDTGKQRQELVDAFQSPLAHPHVPPFRVIIGTSQIIGQGLTLTRSHRTILMEPSRHAAVEAQNADRTHRLGSQTDKCRFYRFVNPASGIERFLVESQERQRDLHHGIEWLAAVSRLPSDGGNEELELKDG
ncbi:hypothetical protein G647_10418 [Cladophialophora carrionii CBS 160.54]|uniref:Helicase C-terminal domain-containing protein n=1 Tax=Cladophialophora carrionii CBS 160.54 TaxID=1279043 RepID=V9DI69_9EURO|nr:uncharacterized protein G647_10418 [Cladophialophora carrionii CBS 160.54]ETI26604.1 hypothetical protein G647_10418 [Cladophialophora carrionii CBS 160.54]